MVKPGDLVRTYGMSGNRSEKRSKVEPRSQVDVEKMAKETKKLQPVKGEEKSESGVQEFWE